jgi:hypothetical protein
VSGRAGERLFTRSTEKESVESNGRYPPARLCKHHHLSSSWPLLPVYAKFDSYIKSDRSIIICVAYQMSSLSSDPNRVKALDRQRCVTWNNGVCVYVCVTQLNIGQDEQDERNSVGHRGMQADDHMCASRWATLTHRWCPFVSQHIDRHILTIVRRVLFDRSFLHKL